MKFSFFGFDHKAGMASAHFVELRPPQDFFLFLRTLYKHMPMNSILAIAGHGATVDVKQFLESVKVEPRLKVSSGSIWPRSVTCHIPLTDQNTQGLANILESHPNIDIPTHLYVYHESEMLLRWNDAPSDPLFISQTLPEEALDYFRLLAISA